MQFTQFLSQLSLGHTEWQKPVVCFQADEYPLFLYTCMISFQERSGVARTNVIDINTSPRDCAADLETLFLGQRCWYVITAREEATVASRAAWVAYLQKYRGPHIVWCVMPTMTDSSSCTVVTMPPHIDKKLFMQIRDIYGMAHAVAQEKMSPFVDTLYEQERQISFDMAWMLLRYESLLPSRMHDFFAAWLPRIAPKEESLFSLSQHFFAKNPQKFFDSWISIFPHYSVPFWISFWSEQLWRATLYVRAAKNRNMQEARSVGHRLPFLFLRRDWQSYDIDELQRAHDALYRLDFLLKNGSPEIQLDLFLHKFMMNVFRTNLGIATRT